MYSCVSLLLLAGNLSREHMIRITIVRLVGKVHFRSDYDILGHDKASFPKIRFIRVGYVTVKDFCQAWIIKLPGLASYLFYQYHCLHVNRVYAVINTFLPPYSKRLFIAMIHRKVFNIKIVTIHFKWRKFLRNIRE